MFYDVVNMSQWRHITVNWLIFVRSPRTKEAHSKAFVSFIVKRNDPAKASPENIELPFG